MSDMLPEPFEPDEEIEGKVKEIIDELQSKTRKLGLYLENVAVMNKPDVEISGVLNVDGFKEQVREGNVVVVGMFVIGDVAWSKRTMDPEQEEIDNQARIMLPDSVEELKEKLRRAKEEGRDLFGEDI